MFIHSPSLQRNVEPARQIVEFVATVAPSNMQVRPDGTARIGESPTGQLTPMLAHRPSSHRYCVPD